jgi:hypothetical protein
MKLNLEVNFLFMHWLKDQVALTSCEHSPNPVKGLLN